MTLRRFLAPILLGDCKDKDSIKGRCIAGAIIICSSSS